MAIRLRPVTAENWYPCTQLGVSEDQKKIFPAPVVYWLAESKYVTEFEPLAIYWGEKLVGFIVYCSKPDGEGDYWIPALMLDVEYQGRGYAKEAMKQLISFMREKLQCRRIMIGHRPDNVVAAKLYEGLGFMRVSDELIDGEVVLAQS